MGHICVAPLRDEPTIQTRSRTRGIFEGEIGATSPIDHRIPLGVAYAAAHTRLGFPTADTRRCILAGVAWDAISVDCQPIGVVAGFLLCRST